MRFDDVADLVANGFTGFITCSELQRTGCRDVPNEGGIYLVIRPFAMAPEFLSESIGGHFKGNNPTLPTAALRAQWVEPAKVLYIGKAGGLSGNGTLKSRLRQYMNFGQGQAVGHWGGRCIWQLADSSSLQICWKVTPSEDPAARESELIQDFRAQYHKRPFANLRN
jgi:hypothetical protein